MTKHEYRNFSPGRDSFFQFLKVCLVALVGFAAVALLINVAVTHQLWQPYLGVQTKKLDRLAQLAPQIDVLFLGTSHIENGVNPAVFNAALSDQGGAAATSFNAAVGDLRGPEILHYLEKMKQVPGLHPRFVLIEPLINPAPPLNRMFTSRVRYHFSWDVVQYGIRARWTGDVPLSRKFGSIGSQLLAMGIHYLNLGVATDVVLPTCPACDDAEREAGPFEERPSRPYDLGFAGEAADPAVLDYRAYAKIVADNGGKRIVDVAGLTEPTRTLTPDEVAYIGRLFAAVRALGATPIALLPPISIELHDYRSLHAGIVRNFPEVKVMDYYYDEERLLDLYSDVHAWFDHTHLAPLGAELFSGRLANDFRAMTAATTPVVRKNAVH